MIDKCKKLLAMSQQSASPEEAANAAAILRKLMDKHQIDEAMLAGSVGEPVFGYAFDGEEYKAAPKWVGELAVAVAKYNDCIVEWYWNENSRKQLKFKGHADDAEVCVAMFQFLVGQIEYLGKINKKVGLNMTDFCNGVNHTVCKRLAALTKERATATESTALVVIKLAAVEDEFGPASYTKSRTSTKDWYARVAGQAAGNNVLLHSAVD